MTRLDDDLATTRVPASILGKMALSAGSLGILLAAGCSEPSGAARSPAATPTLAQPVSSPTPPASPGTVTVTAPEPGPVPGCKLPALRDPEVSEPATTPTATPETEPGVAPAVEPVPELEPEKFDDCPACGRG